MLKRSDTMGVVLKFLNIYIYIKNERNTEVPLKAEVTLRRHQHAPTHHSLSTATFHAVTL